MKWYMALNEEGTRGDIALHTKIAVLSALKHTKLEPKMLYIGERNEFTIWLEQHGVEVLDQKLPYLSVIDGLTLEGRYSKATTGHWLRTNTCIAEQESRYILYTDIDVMFLRDVNITDIYPKVFSAAPEFNNKSWNYFNAGVMIQNIDFLRDDYSKFEIFLREELREKTYSFHDQIAYNIFYKDKWEHLPLILNWKPYWGVNPDAEIIHFHGPKIGAVEAILDNKWNWDSSHGIQIGSMVAGFVDSYRFYFRKIIDESIGLSEQEIHRISTLCVKLDEYVVPIDRKIDLGFMKFKMFAE